MRLTRSLHFNKCRFARTLSRHRPKSPVKLAEAASPWSQKGHRMIRRFALTSVLLLAAMPAVQAIGEETTTARKVLLPSSTRELPSFNSSLSEAKTLPANWETHPLARAIKFAAEHRTFIDEHVKDFSCILAKRERINGRLHDYEYLRTNVRAIRAAAVRRFLFRCMPSSLLRRNWSDEKCCMSKDAMTTRC